MDLPDKRTEVFEVKCLHECYDAVSLVPGIVAHLDFECFNEQKKFNVCGRFETWQIDLSDSKVKS